ncbi:MAG: hypothetical protein Q7S74_06665 [Nanoarchaeota archaeon]|nr:hypothetical protein [Nanoarchaeota archaeon]
MAVTNILTPSATQDLATTITLLGRVGLWLQAVGILALIIIIFYIVNFFINRKRLKELYKTKEDVKRIEKKIDLILIQTKKR